MENARETAGTHTPAQQEHGHSPRLTSASSHHASSDQEHQRAERFYWRVNSITAAVATGAAIAAAVFAAGAYNASWQGVAEARRQADIARAALITGDRPWIRVIGLSNVHLHISVDHVTLSFNVDLKNVGRSPAKEVFVDTTLLADGGFTEHADHAASICKNARANGYDPAKGLIFPDAVEPRWETAHITAGEVITINNQAIMEEVVNMKRIYGQAAAKEREAELRSRPYYLSPVIIGCVTYNIPVGDVIGQTSFIFNVYRACGARSKRCTFAIERATSFKPDELSVAES